MTRLRTLQMPSPALIVAGLALIVASGGTAYAASSIVNIADPTNPANKAGVTSAGQLKTSTTISSGHVGQALAAKSFSLVANATLGTTSTVIGPSTATIGLTRVQIYDDFNQQGPVKLILSLFQGGSGCQDPTVGSTVGVWGVLIGESTSEDFTTPITLSPSSPGTKWCLVATAVVGGQAGYQTPALVTVSGFVQSGSLPSGATSSDLPTSRTAPRTAPGHS